MTIAEILEEIRNYLEELYEKYGDSIEYLEVYDGRIIPHFKKDEGDDNAD